MQQISATLAVPAISAQDWQPLSTIPRDGTLLDVRFDIEGAEPGMAEFYAPRCTGAQATPPVIANVAFSNGAFCPITTAFAARSAQAMCGAGTPVAGMLHGILSVTLNAWRRAVTPPQDDLDLAASDPRLMRQSDTRNQGATDE